MAECPDGRTNRGTRSQFRVGLPGLGLCKGFYPINLGKIMDAGQSSQISSSSSSSTSLISPCKGTHTLTVREYEQTIYELKKENFDLKLKLYVCDETHMKTCRDKDNAIANNEMVQVIVHLKSESETLQSELKEKEKLLQDALERAEKLESDFKRLEKLNAELQSELTSFSELPSKEEILSLLEEKENFVNHTESLESLIKEKEEEIDTLNQKMEFLANENTRLEEKIKKRSIAIQSFVYKNFKEKEMLPDEFRNIVVSAIQAAKNKNKDDLAVSLKTFTSALNKIMSATDLSQSEEKENIRSSEAKCLKGEIAEKSTGSFLSSHSESPSHVSQIQDLKVLSERNISDTKQAKILDPFVHHSYIRKEMIHQSAVDIPEKDCIEFCDISPSTEEKLVSFTERLSLQTCSVSKPNLIDIQTISSLPEKDTPESDQFVNILKENKRLKHDLEEKLAIISDLHTVCEELKEVKALQDIKSDASKASQKYCVSTQTKIAGSNLLEECEIIKLQKNAKLSDNVEELREDILLLLLAIEEKNKELCDVKETLAVVQKDMKKAMSTSMFDKDFYLHERNELHERLALSCSVNEELMRHLKNLEKFMEDLLQHKFDSSLESDYDKSGFMSSVSRCLNESLKLSMNLSNHLSICEGSKLFEECESFAYKNSSYSEEKNVSYLGLNKLSMCEQPSYFGHRKFEECVSYIKKNNLSIGKESDSSQLCGRCWQQLNPPLNQSEVPHVMQNNSLNKPAGYQSSDSDIWSEPDRNVSMQRIGISLQNSPVSTKSPRKLRPRDKRMSSKISSKEDTSTSECQQAFKKRQGSATRRLFVKEDAKTQDFALDKFYFLVAEKYSKLKSLLDNLGNIQDAKLSDDGWTRLNRLVYAVGEALQKLHFAQENAKTSSVCGKCVMLDLFSNLKASHVEADFFIYGTSSEKKILQEFSRELCLLKESCKEPFSLLYESISKQPIGTQCDILTGSEHIKELETDINNLNIRNKELDENLEKINCLFSKEKEELVSIKAENSNLLNKIDNLKIDLLDMRYKEEQLEKKLSCATKNNSEMNSVLKDLKQKNEESTTALDQLTAELEKKRLDLIDMNKECLNYEKQLNEQTHMRENSENKLKILESESLSEKHYLLHKIEDLKSEKKCTIQELKTIQEEKLALEKENAVINDRLLSKNNELLSLKRTIEKLQNIKETQSDIENESVSKEKIIFESIKVENFKLLDEINHLKDELLSMKSEDKELSFKNKSLLEKLDDVNKENSELNQAFEDLKQKMEESCSTADQLRSELQKNILDLDYMNKKCSVYEKELNEQIHIKEKYDIKLKSLETYSATEKENYVNQLRILNEEKNRYVQELKDIKEEMLVLEKENVVLNNNLHSKSFELSSLKKTVELLQNEKQALISDNKVAESKEAYESIETENHKLLSQINQLKEKMSHMENEVKELCFKNNNLVDELMHLRKNNSELNNSLKCLEQKRKESSVDLDQLTSKLQKYKSDFLHMNDKCIEYEKQLNEQNHLRQNSEFKLKKLESESLSERNYYSRKIDDLNAEKNHCIQEVKTLQAERLALEKENAVINDRLQSKNNELLSLKGTIDKLQSLKETQSDAESESVAKEKIIFESIKAENFRMLDDINHLKDELLDMKYKDKESSLENKNLLEKLGEVNKKYSELTHNFKDLEHKMEDSRSTADQLSSELQKNRLDLTCMNKKCSDYKKELDEQTQMKEKFENELKTVIAYSTSEKQNYLNQLNSLNEEKNHCMQELKNIREKMLALEKANVVNNNSHSKNFELSSLKKTTQELQNDEKATKRFSESKDSCESIESENHKLVNQINQLKEKLSHMEDKEKELCLRNKKLVDELMHLSSNNSELNSSFKSLEQERKQSSVEQSQLTAELQKHKSDLIHMNEKCIEYEKQLTEQKHLRQNSEFKLKNFESESLSEKNYYSHKIDDLNAEKNHCIQELKILQEERIALEKENAVIKDRLQSKNNELLSLKGTIEKLQSLKETESDIENESVAKEKIIFESIKAENFRLLDEISHLKEELSDVKYKYKESSFENKNLLKKLNDINKKFSDLNHAFEDLKQKYNESTTLENQLRDEVKKYKSYLSDMNKKCIEYEAKLNEKIQKEEKTENDLNALKLNSLSEKESYVLQLNALTAEKNSLEDDLQNIKIENLELSSQISKVKEELSDMKNKEKELYLKNEKLVEELIEVGKSNSELKNTLKFLEQSRKDSNNELDNLTAELKKKRTDLVNLSERCLAYEKELNEKSQLKEKYENDLKSQESNFTKQKNHYLQKLQSVQEKTFVLEKEIDSINDQLESKNNKICFLQKTLEELQKAKEELDSNYEELQNKLVNSQECQTNLEEKCKKCEAIILKYKDSESEYLQKLKQLQAKSKTDEEEKLNEISALTKERDNILLKLKSEKECNKRLKAENADLNENHLKSSQQISILKQRVEFFENALLSSNKECESLNKDLKCLRSTLQNLESKCLMYEKQLVATAGMKDNLTECLLNINNEFSVQRQKLNEMCKMYGNDNSVVWDESSFTKFMPVIDEDNVSKLCENIVSETKKLSQSVDILLYVLKSYHLKSIETETSGRKADSLEKEIELHKTQVDNLRLQNDQLQTSVSEKEKSIQSNAYEIKSLKEKLQSNQKEIDRENQLIQRKDDEITMLQERIFNLQMYVNSIMTDKKDLLEKTTSVIKPEIFTSSNNQLPSKIVSTNSKMCQTEECEGLSRSLDESFTSVSSLESGKCRGCEKYWKKCYSLQTKLALCQKHIDILEKDKSDLKDRLLQQLQSKKDLGERSDTSISKLSELESKLEKKKLFITELKSELLKTCNALIDKEKEVDDLKQTLSECKVKYQHGVTDIPKQQSAEIFNSVDVNVKTLKDHKWKLIQTIFDMQRKFYEKKGIHLNYFDRFKEHVNNLYSLQLIPSMSKSQSMPLLRSHALKKQYEQGNEKVKRLADLELDIECLENLKIFLNRFLLPCVFQTSETCDKETKTKQQAISSDSLSLLRRTESHKESKHEIADILNLSFPNPFITADDGKTLRIDDIAVTVSQHLDYMQKFFESVTKINWLEILNVFKDSVEKVSVKTLLLKIFQEINVLNERADKLFNFSSEFKNFNLVSLLHVTSTSKLDTSDRESIMSDETIAVSRTDSPLSFEDICPIKLPHPDTLQLEEVSLKPGSTRNRVTVIEPYNAKIAVVDGSCDSVCQRSHYSSPDLGIESDPNHDSSAPEHKEDGTNKFPFKLQQTKTAFTSIESAGRWSGPNFGDTCYAVGTLSDFELLKQEIKESLVAIKSVLSRTGDGLHHIAKYTSPRKTLEYNTLKSIKDSCVHMEVCLKKANNLVSTFWTAPCPTEKEWKMLKEENQKLSENLASLRMLVEKQENDFKTAIGKLERAQAVKDNIEKKISKKLVKTKKLIRQAELKLLETRCQNVPPVPKYPSEQSQEADAH